MDVSQAIQLRRAYRSLDPAEITPEVIEKLGTAAQLTCSCFNKQPWRFVFVYDPKQLEALRPALNKGNEWVFKASLIIAVCSQLERDCVVKEREYHLFDVGMAVGFMLLQATELGLVAHPIAGFDSGKIKEVLGIPEEEHLITIVNCGVHSTTIDPALSDWQKEAEVTRPPRLPLEEIVHHNHW